MSRLLSIATVSLAAASTLSLAAQQPVATATATRAVRSTITNAALAKAKANALAVIQGNALNSTNGRMSNAIVRLRDARFGRIVGTQITDKSGLFAFKAIDPGSYIVELMSSRQSILAASQLLNVNGGESVLAVVKMPFDISPLAGPMGIAGTPSATAVATQAAESGIVGVAPTVPVSPRQ